MALLGASSLPAASLPAASKTPEKAPNIVFVHTDQLRAGALSSAQNPHVSTPNLDRLASRSTSFTKAYSANPVCVPARSSWYTGHLSSYHGAINNGASFERELVDAGRWFSSAGYRSVYVGKWHIPRRPRSSFEHFHHGRDHGLLGDAAISHAAAGFLERYDDPRPLFLNVGYHQPHDMCFWYFEQANRKPTILPGIELPPPPPNWRAIGPEPRRIVRIREKQASKQRLWAKDTWRYALWSYYRQVEQVDVEIGRLLAALESSGHDRETWVMFSTDHGELCGSHGLILKSCFYEEAARVPFFVRPPRAARNRVDSTHVVHGIDVFPTLCDIAGIDSPPDLPGRSLVPLIEGPAAPDWPTHRVFESGARGRMVRSERFKYVTYRDDPIEQLFDLEDDPFELDNLVTSAGVAEVLAEHREVVRKSFEESKRVGQEASRSSSEALTRRSSASSSDASPQTAKPASVAGGSEDSA